MLRAQAPARGAEGVGAAGERERELVGAALLMPRQRVTKRCRGQPDGAGDERHDRQCRERAHSAARKSTARVGKIKVLHRVDEARNIWSGVRR